MSAYDRRELLRLGQNSTRDLVGRKVSRLLDNPESIEYLLPTFSYPLADLQSAASMFERLDRSHPDLVRHPAVLPLQEILREGKEHHQHIAVFMYVHLRHSGRDPEPEEPSAGRFLLRRIHEIVEHLGVEHDVFVGALRGSGFMSICSEGEKPSGEGPVSRLPVRARSFVFASARSVAGSLRRALSLGRYQVVIGFAAGRSELDMRNLSRNRHLRGYQFVADSVSPAANKASHIARLKGEFEELARSLSADQPVSLLGLCDAPDLSSSFRRTFADGYSESCPIAGQEVLIYPDLTELPVVAGSGRNWVLAVDIDIGNSTGANDASPDTFATYRRHLREELVTLQRPGLVGGIWSGDGMQFLSLLPPEPAARGEILCALWRDLIECLDRQRRLRGEFSSCYLRVGIAIGEEASSFARLLLGRGWGNPEVEITGSRLLQVAESLQESARKQDNEANDDLVVINSEFDLCIEGEKRTIAGISVSVC